MRIQSIVWTICTVIVVGLLTNTQSFAYNYKTHTKIVETAIGIMQHTPNDANPPAGVDAIEWRNYVEGIKSALDKLSTLQIGTLQRGKTDSLRPADDDPCTCQYDEQSNMQNVELNRVCDFAYTLNRSDENCGLTAISDQSYVLGNVLGWHAGTVDDHQEDVVLELRLTNILGLGALKDITNEAWDNIVGALVAPFYCFAKWFQFESCGFDDCKDLASQVNPVDIVDSWFPGIPLGSISSSDYYTGVWHFMAPGSSTGQYNDVHGMNFEEAGPNGRGPGALDVTVMVGADLVGFSLDADESDGVARYGAYDERHRTRGRWQSTTIGHVEFSPMQNLALYGWNNYPSHPTRASDLGWPLHAVADATTPQHIATTIGWGHQPYEDAVDEYWNDMNLQAQGILVRGFYQWRSLNNAGDFKNWIIQLGTWTEENSDWAFNDDASTAYFLANGFNADKSGPIHTYQPYVNQMQGLVEEGIGATIALLVEAGKLATDPGYDASVKCASGTYFDYGSDTCQDGIRTECCTTAGQSCSDNAECCAGLNCIEGSCTSTIVPSVINGESCIPQGGACTIWEESSLSCCSNLYCDVGIETTTGIGTCEMGE